MITEDGKRQYRTGLFARSVALLMWTGALIAYRGAPEKLDFWTLGIGIGLAIAGALAPKAATGMAEWKARAADRSTLAEQAEAEAAAVRAPTVADGGTVHPFGGGGDGGQGSGGPKV